MGGPISLLSTLRGLPLRHARARIRDGFTFHMLPAIPAEGDEVILLGCCQMARAPWKRWYRNGSGKGPVHSKDLAQWADPGHSMRGCCWSWQFCEEQDTLYFIYLSVPPQSNILLQRSLGPKFPNPWPIDIYVQGKCLLEKKPGSCGVLWFLWAGTEVGPGELPIS